MMANASPVQNVINQGPAANGLAIVRVTIGAMLVCVFFETWVRASTHPGATPA